MTVKTPETTLTLTQNLEARNKEVTKAYAKIVAEARKLVAPFENQKYRTTIEIDHTKSGKDTNLISEFVCFFFNITLTKNRADYNMIYGTFDEEAIAKFGSRLHNRFLRQLFKHTMFENTKYNIEDCIRVNDPAKVQNFFVNRLLANGESDWVAISVEEKA